MGDPTPTSFSIELVKQLPAILGALAGIVASVLAYLSLKRGADNTKKIGEVHELVNGRSGVQEAKLDAARGELVALKQEIAARPGSTSEERVRATVAMEQQQRAATIAAATPPKETTP